MIGLVSQRLCSHALPHSAVFVAMLIIMQLWPVLLASDLLISACHDLHFQQLIGASQQSCCP